MKNHENLKKKKIKKNNRFQFLVCHPLRSDGRELRSCLSHFSPEATAEPAHFCWHTQRQAFQDAHHTTVKDQLIWMERCNCCHRKNIKATRDKVGWRDGENSNWFTQIRSSFHCIYPDLASKEKAYCCHTQHLFGILSSPRWSKTLQLYWIQSHIKYSCLSSHIL